MFKLIAFTGLAGAGKNTAADLFTVKHRYIEESFARRPKEAIRQLFGLSPEQVFGTKEQKEAVIPALSNVRPVSPRLMLQTFCTDWGRDMIDPDIWTYPVAKSWDTMKGVPGFAGMVISDLRFDNEAEWVKSQGGIIIEVCDNRHGNTTESHVSESGINRKWIDGSVFNKHEGVDMFHKDVMWLVDELMKRAAAKWVPVTEELIERRDIRRLITEWADEVFPNRTVTNALQKMVMEEIPEFLSNQTDAGELADIGILLYDIAHLTGIDLDSAIREKMEINRARTWKIDDQTGLMKHVKPPITLNCPSVYADTQAAESEGGEA